LGEIVHTSAGKAIRKVMGQSKDLESLESDTGDAFLGEERTMESRDHEKVHGFPSSIVPTMEEKVVMDTLDSIPEDSQSSRESKGEEGDADEPQKPQSEDAQEPQENTSPAEPKSQDANANGDAQILEVKQDHSGVRTPGSAKSIGNPSTAHNNIEARVDDGELYGAPADASKDPKTDDEPPHAVSGKNDATETEEKAVPARAEVRKHLSTKFNPKVWTLPTPTPEVDPHGFEDPISDKFWKKVWMASAVHNVGVPRKTYCSSYLIPFAFLLDRDLSQGLPRCP
jgi:phospholipase D1/2